MSWLLQDMQAQVSHSYTAPSLSDLQWIAQISRPSAPLLPAMVQQPQHRRFRQQKPKIRCGLPGDLIEGGPIDDKHAVTQFLTECMVRGDESSWQELRKLAPQYQARYHRFLDKKEQEQLACEREQLAYERELRALERERYEEVRKVEKEMHEKLGEANAKFTELERKATAKIESLGNLVITMEEKEGNSGLRLVVESMLRQFNGLHFSGGCSDPSCERYLQQLVLKKVIAPTATGGAYTLLKETWSKVDAIAHYAVCPYANLRDVYKDAVGNQIVSMRKSDLQSELAQRASLIWSNLHGPHHVLSIASPAKLRIRFGPNSNRADTLFLYSAGSDMNFDVEIVPEVRAGSVREEVIRILESPLTE